jgi:hypothetical protein
MFSNVNPPILIYSLLISTLATIASFARNSLTYTSPDNLAPVAISCPVSESILNVFFALKTFASGVFL